MILETAAYIYSGLYGSALLSESSTYGFKVKSLIVFI